MLLVCQIQNPAIDSAEVVKFIKEQAANHLVDVYPIAAATVGRKGEIISPMAELVDAGAVGFSDDGIAIKTSSILRRAFEYANMFNTPIIEHCEDESLADGAMNEGVNSTLLGSSRIAFCCRGYNCKQRYFNGRIHRRKNSYCAYQYKKFCQSC